MPATRVTPTRRLAHWLRARHDAALLASGREAWTTPDIVTWDELIERMFERDRAAGRLEGRWLAAGAAHLLWQRIVREDPQTGPLVSTVGIARAAQHAWQRAHDYRMPLDALEADASAEVTAFARWCHRYRRLLEEHGWIDAALAQSAVHGIAAAPSIDLVGFDRLLPLQEVLIERWAAAGLQVRQAAAPRVPGQVRRVQALDPAAEIEAAARWAAARLDGRAGIRVAIVVPDLGRRRAEVRRIVDRVVAPATGLTGGPDPETRAFELAAAPPLVEQPVVAGALDLLDLFAHPSDLASLSRLLRNPWIAGGVDEAAARARLDARLRRAAGSGLGLADLERMAEPGDCPRLARILAEGLVKSSGWSEKKLPSSWSISVSSLLDSAGWGADQTQSDAYQAAQRMRVLISELGALDEFSGAVTRAEVVGLLREMAGGVLFEPQELRAPLLVIDPETCAGMDFDGLWVCGLDAARWPPPVSPDPLLPRLLQIRHGVPRATADLSAREATETLGRLVASAPEVILSVPETVDEAPVLASPLLAGIAPLGTASHWPSPRLAVFLRAQRPVLETLVDVALPPLGADEGRRGGARLLELQSACPFRAQAEIRLGARVLESPGVGVDAAERGDLVHRALALLWTRLGDQAALLALDAPGLVALVRHCVMGALAEARRAADELTRHLLDLEADWLETRVLEMVEADRARAAFVVEAVEAPRTAAIGALALDLRLDRVDRLEDGSLAVIDYKTGANAAVASWLDERPRLPQLPAYVQAIGAERVGAVAFARLRSGDTGYAGLARTAATFPGLKVAGDRGWPRDLASWDELLGAWRRRLEVLAAEYAAGDARLAPDPAKACRYCHLGALCRIAETGVVPAEEEAADE